MTVAARRGLFDEGEMDRVLTSGGGVGGGIAGGNHQGDFVNPGGQHFFDDDFQGRFLGAVVIDQRLQRQRPLSPAGRGDDRFANVHRGFLAAPLAA